MCRSYYHAAFLLLFSLLPKLNCQTDDRCILTPCNIQGDAIKFFIFGDWGGQNNWPFFTNAQLKSADALDKVGRKENINFYISTGDHFYFNGVQNVDDPRFKAVFEDVFNKPAHQKMWHLVAGNHDYYKNISAQVAYTKKSWRWNFPSLYFTISYHLNGKPFSDFVMIDTMILCGNTRDSAHEIPPGPKDRAAAELEWNWIETQLAASRAPYLFIVGHYPPRSKGYHGPTTACMVDRIERLMARYNVTAYLAGHDHNLQHYRYTSPTGHMFNYIVSGVGAMNNNATVDRDEGESLLFYPSPNRNLPDLMTKLNQGGFVLAALKNSTASFRFYDGNENVLFTSNLSPRKPLVLK